MILGEVISAGVKLIDKYMPDPEAAQKAKQEFVESVQKAEIEIIKQQSENIRAEMSGDSWLQRNWRPVVMLNFAALISAHWLGWTAPNLSEGEITGLLDIVKVGIGGYVLGRSAEKTMKAYKK